MRSFLDILFKRKVDILGIALVATLLTLFGNYLLTPVYESRAQILVRVGREVTLPTTVMAQPLNIYFNRAEQVNTQLQILNNRHLVELTLKEAPPPIAEKVASGFLATLRSMAASAARSVIQALRSALEFLGLTTPLSPEQKLVVDTQKRLNVERVKSTEVLEVTFRHPDPAYAKQFLETFLALYLQASSQAMETPGSRNFFAGQADAARETYNDAQKRLIDFRSQWQIYEPAVQKEHDAQEMSRLNDALRSVDLEISLFEAKKKTLQAGETVESSLPSELREDQAIVESLKNLVQLKMRLNQMRQDLGPGHPNVQALSREIDTMRGNITREALGILSSRLAVLAEKRREILAQQDALRGQIALLDAKWLEMATLEQAVELARKNLRNYAEREETSRVNLDMDQAKLTSAVVIEAPLTPFTPVSPKRLLNLLLGAFIGLFFGGLYAFGSEYAAGTINQPEELERLLGAKAVVSLPDAPVFNQHLTLRR